ncbi:competence-related pilin export protein ComGA [Psychrobacillus insolitus]|uniref:Competence-related pilin export protein ComGA n=1 Tax=Psychrobacillus insolitus TaxID=1461 RepID=A0A2W7MTV0_9BACI|nr:competence type IV pilus ATPase ComGA [Psychrobacillus insolitus]PZX07231.1 competence-related pilin export protein ComGA [Psychrobacillus insolitus]
MEQIENVVEQKCFQLLKKALNFGASDLHMIPNEESYIYYFKKNSQMFEAGKLPLNLGERIISFFKFLSSLDISEKRKPQSGSFHQIFNTLKFSFRVSTLPSVFGKESLVIRLQQHDNAKLLHSLALFQTASDQIVELANNRQGLILFVGPTGSGKSTSMYSLTKYCSENLHRHVISLEDPVENNQSHLLQIQVNERSGVTYATGLKAILRHSPDVIMIGEIRDEDTAKAAIQAALTGHLVVSTIHAKDGVGAMYRLMDLGVSIDELKQTVSGIVTQSLVSVYGAKQDELSAIYEIVSDELLVQVFDSILTGKKFLMPNNLTLSYQIERGVRDGIIQSNP